jgi:hypothetical protein
MKLDSGIKFLIGYAVAALLLLALVAFLCSCEVLKKRKSETTTTTKVATVDSGKTEKTTIKEQSKEDWWREVAEFLPKGDTTVINNYTTTPVRIIREGGTIQKETDFEKLFLEYLNKKDTTTAVVQKVDNTTERSFLTIWHLLAVGGGAVLVTLLINKIKIVRV